MFSTGIDEANKGITKINNAAARMRIGHGEGMNLLKSYVLQNEEDAKLTKQKILDYITENYST